MKQLEPDCLFSSMSDTCQPDEYDHPHHKSCSNNIHPHPPRVHHSVSSSSSGQLYRHKINDQGTLCPQIIKSNHEVNNESSCRTKRDHPQLQNTNAQNRYIFNNYNRINNYSSKRCYRSLSLPVLLILVLSMPSIIYPVSAMQKGAALQKQEQQLQQKDQLVEMEEDPESCRLEDSIPGTPGDDYPTYTDIPDTAFKCSDKQFPGYYADVEAQCQVFHVCQADGRKDSFLCPVGTIFNQELFVCDWWNNFRCQDAASFSDLNSELYITPKSQPSSNLLQKRTNKYELENNSLASDEREREDSIEEDDVGELFEERVTVTAAPIQARKGLFGQNLQTNSQLQQQEIKGRVQDVKGKQVDTKGRQQEAKTSPQKQVTGKLQQQEVKGRIQEQEVKGKLQQQQQKEEQIKGNLKQEPAKLTEIKGSLQAQKTSTTYGTRLSGRSKASLISSRTPIENTSDDWDDDIGTTEAITTTQTTTAPSWTFKPTPTTTAARIMSAQVKQSKQELKSPAQLKNAVKYERLVDDGKEEFVYWDSRFDNRQQTKSQFQQQMAERQRQIPVQQQQVQNEPVQQRQQLQQQIKSSRLEIDDRWTPMITTDFKAPLIQTTTTTARSTTPSTTTTTSRATPTTTTSATRAPTNARLVGKKGGRARAKTSKLIQTTTVAPVTESNRQQLSERFVYWDSRFGDQQLTQQEQAALEQEEQADQKAKLQRKQDRDGRTKQGTSQKSEKFQQSSELRSAFEDEWDAISKEAEKMKETLSSTPPTSTRTAKTTTPKPTTTRITTSVTAAPLIQSRKGNIKTSSEKQVKKSEPLRAIEADFDDQPMSSVCDWWHSPDCRDSSSSSSASNEKENLKEDKQGYVAPMQIVSYRTSVNHDDRATSSKLTSTTNSWETDEERDEREREGDSLSLDDPSEPEERASVTLAPLINSKKSERLKQPASKIRVQEQQSSKVRKQTPASEQRRKVVSNFGGRIVTKAQTKSQKKQKQQTLEDGTSASKRQTKVTIGPAIVTTSSIPGESEAYTIFKTLKPRATSPTATATSQSTSSVTISIRV